MRVGSRKFHWFAAASAMCLSLFNVACGDGGTSTSTTSGSSSSSGDGGSGGQGGQGGQGAPCEGAADGTPCGDAATTECDGPDTCQAGKCVQNLKAAGEACGDATDNECTKPDTCDGAGTCVVNDAAMGTPCGDSADTDCTDPDTCSGSGTCLSNHAAMGSACGDTSTTACSNPDTCNDAGTCLDNHAAMGTACGDPSDTDCTDPDSCNDAGACLANNATMGTACGDLSATACTDPDTCDNAGTCLANHAAMGTTCGDPSDTACTDPDSCNGAGTCLANDAAMGAACGDPSDTACTDPDTCNGAGMCLVNHAATGTACGDNSTTDCNAADSCDGLGVCLANQVADGAACFDCPAGPGQCDVCTSGTCLDTPVCQNGYASTTSILETTFAGGNNHNGNIFDVTALSTVTITGFDVSPLSATTYEVYTKAGSFVGFEANPAAWTKVGTYPGIPAGTTVPLPKDLNVTVTAGQTQAFYVTATGATAYQNYTDGTAVGNVYAQDANLQFREGLGLGYPFGDAFSPRIFNGRIHYSGVPLATTGFAGGAQHAGNMFDVQALANVEVTSMSVNLPAGTHDVELYYRPGTHVGFESNAGAWSMLGASNGIVSSGTNVATLLPFNVGLIMETGSTYSFYVTTKGTNLNSTVGTMVGAPAYTGASFNILEGVGNAYPFGTTTAPRRWNGTLYYENCLP